MDIMQLLSRKYIHCFLAPGLGQLWTKTMLHNFYQ